MFVFLFSFRPKNRNRTKEYATFSAVSGNYKNKIAVITFKKGIY